MGACWSSWCVGSHRLRAASARPAAAAAAARAAGGASLQWRVRACVCGGVGIQQGPRVCLTLGPTTTANLDDAWAPALLVCWLLLGSSVAPAAAHAHCWGIVHYACTGAQSLLRRALGPSTDIVCQCLVLGAAWLNHPTHSAGFWQPPCYIRCIVRTSALMYFSCGGVTRCGAGVVGLGADTFLVCRCVIWGFGSEGVLDSSESFVGYICRCVACE